MGFCVADRSMDICLQRQHDKWAAASVMITQSLGKYVLIRGSQSAEAYTSKDYPLSLPSTQTADWVYLQEVLVLKRPADFCIAQCSLDTFRMGHCIAVLGLWPSCQLLLPVVQLHHRCPWLQQMHPPILPTLGSAYVQANRVSLQPIALPAKLFSK